MDQPYSPWADWLSKFHTWPEAIQALWLIAVPLTMLGLTWLLMRGLRDLIGPARHDEGRLIYGVYQDARGRWMVYRHNRQPEAIDWENPPPELIEHRHLIHATSRRPEELGLFPSLSCPHVLRASTPFPSSTVRLFDPSDCRRS